MEAIVTGATGFIGSALIDALLREGWRVWGVGTDPEKLERFQGERGFVGITARFEDYRDLEDLVGHAQGSVFFHCAWAGGFTDAIADYHLQMENAAYAGDAVLAASAIGCRRFVYAGTYNEYELLTLLGHSEPRFRRTCIYTAGKLAADVVCRTLAEREGIEYCGAYIPMPYGEGNKSMQLVNVVLSKLLAGESPDLIEGENLYDLVYVGDIASALMAIAERGVDRRGYYVGHRRLKTFREWMELLRDVVAPGVQLNFGAYKDTQCIDYALIDLDALYRDTGFECEANFSETMRVTAEWFSRYLHEERGGLDG